MKLQRSLVKFTHLRNYHRQFVGSNRVASADDLQSGRKEKTEETDEHRVRRKMMVDRADD